MPKSRSISRPCESKAEPSSHCHARGNGAANMRSRSPSPSLFSSLAASPRSAGSAIAQRSTAAWRVDATVSAERKRPPSDETTISLPSRLPSGSVASFIGQPCSYSDRNPQAENRRTRSASRSAQREGIILHLPAYHRVEDDSDLACPRGRGCGRYQLGFEGSAVGYGEANPKQAQSKVRASIGSTEDTERLELVAQARKFHRTKQKASASLSLRGHEELVPHVSPFL